MIIAFDDLAALMRVRSPVYAGKVALAHGCFDVFHAGHLDQFKAAKEVADILVVTITPNNFVNKGRCRPIFNEMLRAAVVASVRHVDYVAVNLWPTAVETIRQLRPTYYIKGIEYKHKMTPALEAEKAAVEAVGGSLLFLGDDISHSTDILNKLLPNSENPDHWTAFNTLEGALRE